MDIKYFGHSSFFIKTRNARLITDPFDPKAVGLKFPKTECDIVTISHKHPDHNFLKQISGEPLIIDMPGEFEKNNLRVIGYQTYHDKKKGAERGENIVYKIDDGETTLLHCGDLGLVPEDSFIDQIGDVDVLLVPVGGFYTIDSDDAVQLVKKIEPSIVIPMHYGHKDLTPNLVEKLTPVDDFLKKIGSEGVKPTSKLTVKKESLGEEMKVVVMEIST